MARTAALQLADVSLGRGSESGKIVIRGSGVNYWSGPSPGEIVRFVGALGLILRHHGDPPATDTSGKRDPSCQGI